MSHFAPIDLCIIYFGRFFWLIAIAYTISENFDGKKQIRTFTVCHAWLELIILIFANRNRVPTQSLCIQTKNSTMFHLFCIYFFFASQLCKTLSFLLFFPRSVRSNDTWYNLNNIHFNKSDVALLHHTKIWCNGKQ